MGNRKCDKPSEVESDGLLGQLLRDQEVREGLRHKVNAACSEWAEAHREELEEALIPARLRAERESPC